MTKTIRLVQLFFFLVLYVAGAHGCTITKYQSMNRDVATWQRVDYALGDRVFSIKFPPNGRFIIKPIRYTDIRRVGDYKILSAIGYDYGADTYNDISEVRIEVSVSRIDEDIECVRDKKSFGDCVLQDAKVSTVGNRNTYEEISGIVWFHEEGMKGEDYSILLSTDHFLAVELNFWRNVLKREDLLEDRKKLFHQILTTAVLN